MRCSVGQGNPYSLTVTLQLAVLTGLHDREGLPSPISTMWSTVSPLVRRGDLRTLASLLLIHQAYTNASVATE